MAFMQDDALAHFSVHAREILYEAFTNHWIGCGELNLGDFNTLKRES